MRIFFCGILITLLLWGCGDESSDEPDIDVIRDDVDLLKTHTHQVPIEVYELPTVKVVETSPPTFIDDDKNEDNEADDKDSLVPARTGHIIFSSDGDIFKMNPDGRSKTNLTDHMATDLEPAWSWDSKQIVFASDRDGSFNLFVMASDGSNLRQITSFIVDVQDPAWSPNNLEIAFSSRSGGIFVLNVNRFVDVLRGKTKIAEGFHPAWSPNGAWIAYNFGGMPDVHIMSVNERVPIRFAPPPIHAEEPVWSPGGQQIAFSAQVLPSPDNFDIFIVDADGNNPVNLTNDAGRDESPTWSPDGQRIAFASWRSSNFNWEIYTINTNGTGLTNITQNGNADDRNPDWR